MFKKLLGVLAVVVLGTSSPAWAGSFAYLIGAGDANPTAQITAAGFTPVGLTDLTAVDLAGVSVLWVTNGDNSAPPSAVTNNIAALSAWVAGDGGVLSYHDRYVSDGVFNMADVLPGAAGVNFVREVDINAANIDILNGTTIVTTGLSNTSLDGGNLSSHGYVDGTTMPFGALGILNRGGATNEIVDFYYQHGAGRVYYSTIPLDFYIGGSGSNPPQNDFVNVYAVNEAKFQASLAGIAVPEPGTLGLLVTGLLGLAAIRERNRARRWHLA
jgi:hypothetical protein